jgi:hypothetical protein
MNYICPQQVEDFKQNQSTKSALHSVFDMFTGEAILSDEDYQHLQVTEAASLFWLLLNWVGLACWCAVIQRYERVVAGDIILS